MKYKTLSEYCKGLKDGLDTVLDMFKGAPKHLRIMNEVLGFKNKATLIPGGRACAKSTLIATIAVLFAKGGDKDIIFLFKRRPSLRFAMEGVMFVLKKLGESEEDWKVSYHTRSICYMDGERVKRRIQFAYLEGDNRGYYWPEGTGFGLVLMDEIDGITKDDSILVDKIVNHARAPRWLVATASFRTMEEAVQIVGMFDKVYRPLTVYDVPLEWIGPAFLESNKDYKKYVALRHGKPCGKMLFDAIVKGIPYAEWEYKIEMMKHLRKNDPQRYYEIVDEERRNDPCRVHTVGEK